MKRIFLKIFILSFLVLGFALPAESLDLAYEFTLQGDGSSRPHIILKITNNTSDILKLVVSRPFIDDYGNFYPNLVTMIHNISARDSDGNVLEITTSQKSITSSNWYWPNPLHYDVVTIQTGSSSIVSVEYDVASNTEIYSGLEAASGTFFGATQPEDFWHGYLELILFRPEKHNDVFSATMKLTVPDGWDYATVYPNIQ